jgi:hypothetical protein
MPKFIVHLFPLVKVKLKQEVEADTYEQAVKTAEELVNLRDFLDSHGGYDSVDIEWAEETPYALVDVVGDSKFVQSRWVHNNVGTSLGEKIYPSFRGLVKWARHICDCFGHTPEPVNTASAALTDVDQELALQRKGPR